VTVEQRIVAPSGGDDRLVRDDDAHSLLHTAVCSGGPLTRAYLAGGGLPAPPKADPMPGRVRDVVVEVWIEGVGSRPGLVALPKLLGKIEDVVWDGDRHPTT
jgi:hypothetical protein